MFVMDKTVPSMDAWIKEAKAQINAGNAGMYLIHNGVVRETPKAQVREGAAGLPKVSGMLFSYDEEKVNAAISECSKMDGITYIRVWLNSGELKVGEDIMYVLVSGDIRPHVIDALQTLVGKIKKECVSEKEL